MKVRELVASQWAAIRQVAGGHGIDRIRWWPPTYGPESSADFLVDGELGSLRELRVDLERALGCKVAIYLAHQAPPELMAGGKSDLNEEGRVEDPEFDRAPGPSADFSPAGPFGPGREGS
jgi:hypothetical protein